MDAKIKSNIILQQKKVLMHMIAKYSDVFSIIVLYRQALLIQTTR